MKKITINALDKNYDIYIGDVLKTLKQFITTDEKVLIITDDTVKDIHLETLKKVVQTDYLFSLPENPENSKNLSSYEKCIDYCVNHYLDRNVLVLAFGGGVVTDFAGFFASTYKRGVRLIHLPTTLLSHDSSVGGKTALNFHEIKNVIGSFYQPDVVIYHLDFLKTLPEKEILSGFGEVFKHDLLSEGYILNQLMDENRSLYQLVDDDFFMEEILYRSILVKKIYIEMDIYDKLGKRQFLNFGHTLAHGIEIIDQYSHGEAVSLGICFDLFLSDNPFYELFYQKLIDWGYFKTKPVFHIEDMLKIIKNDKKNENEFLKFIGLYRFGQPYEINLTIEEFKEKLTQFKMVLL
ncbi:3-dehydroquinate synthase [Mycoplasmatota bacterium]|nr:3-dehydroquinate synthase [Mycoplasmatota bacterium]